MESLFCYNISHPIAFGYFKQLFQFEKVLLPEHSILNKHFDTESDRDLRIY